MGKKKRHTTVVTIRDTPIIEGGFNESKDGFIYHCNTPGRNIHLTCYSRDGKVNAHIKDSDFGDEKVWEVEMSVDEVNTQAHKWVMTSIKQYHGNKKYWQMKDDFFLSLRNLFQTNLMDSKVEFDLEKIIKDIGLMKGKSQLVKWVRIRDGIETKAPGLLFSKTQSYLVAPINEHQMVQFNTNLKKTIFGMTPFGMGIMTYYRYLEKKGILTKQQILNDPMKKKALTALEASLIMETQGIKTSDLPI
jgi:hypothetical protein